MPNWIRIVAPGSLLFRNNGIGRDKRKIPPGSRSQSSDVNSNFSGCAGMTAFTEPIVTDRLRIRPIERTDIPRLAMLGRDPEVFRWIPEISGPFDAREWVEELCAHPENYFRHAIELLGTGDVIGAIQLNRRANLLLQLGYWFGKAYWGQGYATESVEALLCFLDARTREPLHAAVHPENLASRAVLENNGFVCLNRYLRDMLEYRRTR